MPPKRKSNSKISVISPAIQEQILPSQQSRDLSDEEVRLARISDLSYQKYAATRRKQARDLGLTYDPELSDKTIAVFTDNKTGKVYISHRGTKLSDEGVKDLASDALVVLGIEKFDKRHKEAQNNLLKVRDKYKDSEIVLASHSLGGTISRNIALENPDLQAYIFAPGTSLGHIKDNYEVSKTDRIKSYSVSGDPLSAFSRHSSGEEAVNVKRNPDASSAHSLSNYTQPERKLNIQ